MTVGRLMVMLSFSIRIVIEEIKNSILAIVEDKNKYKTMKKTAQQKGMEVFPYKKIAKKAIEI
jgi:hypothetical protein